MTGEVDFGEQLGCIHQMYIRFNLDCAVTNERNPLSAPYLRRAYCKVHHWDASMGLIWVR